MCSLETLFPSIKKFADQAIIKNIIGLYVIQIAGYVLPLLTLPYLLRVLGPEGFGTYLFSLSCALWASTVVEYGFNLSAARDVSRARLHPDTLKSIVSLVLAAKVPLMMVVLLAEVIIATMISTLHNVNLLLSIVIYTAALGFSSNWYFQGKEKLFVVSLIELGSRILGNGSIFVFVHSPEDVWKAVGSLGLSGCISTGVPMLWMLREVGFHMPTWKSIWGTIRGGWHFFLYRSVSSVYSSVGVFLLGILGTPQVVGYYGAAEKLIRACISLFTPIVQSLYPRMSFLALRDRCQFHAFFRFWSTVMLSGSILIFIILELWASKWIIFFAGDSYRPSIPVLQILAGLIPVSTASTFLTLSMLAMDKERFVVYSSTGMLVGNMLLVPVAFKLGSITGVSSVTLGIELVQVTVLMWIYRKGKRMC